MAVCRIARFREASVGGDVSVRIASIMCRFQSRTGSASTAAATQVMARIKASDVTILCGSRTFGCCFFMSPVLLAVRNSWHDNDLAAVALALDAVVRELGRADPEDCA